MITLKILSVREKVLATKKARVAAVFSKKPRKGLQSRSTMASLRSC
jgi:hypothetical protein